MGDCDSSRGHPAKLGQPSRTVGADWAAGADEVLDQRTGPVGEVVGAILERDRHPIGAPRPAAVEAPAKELEGAEVDVVVEEAPHLGGRARALEGHAGDVDLHFGEHGATLRGHEAPPRRAVGHLPHSRGGADAEVLAGGNAAEPQLAADVLQSPVGGRPWGARSM